MCLIWGFVTATDLATELWLVVDYHKNGSLFEFLNSAHGMFPDDFTATRSMLSIASGLCYLHQNIRGSPPDCQCVHFVINIHFLVQRWVSDKPAIAHCDLKSRNILVKDDLTCCIADFGLAVTPEHFLPAAPDYELRRRRFIIGTRRYCPPDLLDMEVFKCNCSKCSRSDLEPEQVHSDNDSRSAEVCRAKSDNAVTFELCRQADLYSVALVLWEMSRRVASWVNRGNCLTFRLLFPSFIIRACLFEQTLQILKTRTHQNQNYLTKSIASILPVVSLRLRRYMRSSPSNNTDPASRVHALRMKSFPKFNRSLLIAGRRMPPPEFQRCWWRKSWTRYSQTVVSSCTAESDKTNFWPTTTMTSCRWWVTQFLIFSYLSFTMTKHWTSLQSELCLEAASNNCIRFSVYR